MTAMCVGGCLILGFSANAMFNYKGVKISSDQKHADMPLQAANEVKPTKHLAETFVGKHSGPTSFNSRKYTSLGHEGLGVDHEAWKAAKAAEQAKRA